MLRGVEAWGHNSKPHIQEKETRSLFISLTSSPLHLPSSSLSHTTSIRVCPTTIANPPFPPTGNEIHFKIIWKTTGASDKEIISVGERERGRERQVREIERWLWMDTGQRCSMISDLSALPLTLRVFLSLLSPLFPSLNGNWIVHSGWPVLDLDLPLPCHPDPVLTFSTKCYLGGAVLLSPHW